MTRSRRSIHATSTPRESTQSTRKSKNSNLGKKVGDKAFYAQSVNLERNAEYNDNKENWHLLQEQNGKQRSAQVNNWTTKLTSKLGHVVNKVKEEVKKTWDTHVVANSITPLRDFAFPTEQGSIVFFSTHKELCKNVFGFDHGEQFIINRGLLSGHLVTVVGVRGNSLWIVVAGDSFAQILPTPPLPITELSSSSPPLFLEQEEYKEESEEHLYSNIRCISMRECFCQYYKITFLSNIDSGNADSNKIKTTLGQLVANKLFSSWMKNNTSIDKIDYSSKLTETATERDFLQNAPDLFVELVQQTTTSEEDNIKSKFMESEQVLEYEKLLPQEEPINMYEFMHKMSHSMIILSPCILANNNGKTLGWTGEGAVVVPYSHVANAGDDDEEEEKHGGDINASYVSANSGYADRSYSISNNNNNNSKCNVNASLSASIVLL